MKYYLQKFLLSKAMRTIYFIILFIFFFGTMEAQFGEPSLISYPWDNGRFELADFDNDGDLDAVGINRNNFLIWNKEKTQLSIFENLDGIGTEWHRTDIDIPDILGELNIGDFNNDGWMDFVVSRYSPNEGLVFFKNTGLDPGIFFSESELLFNFLNVEHKDVIIQDYNLDGYLDVIFFSSNNILSATNIDGNNYVINTIASLSIPMNEYYELEFRDLDADGDEDIVLLYGGSISLSQPIKMVFFENLNGVGDFGEEILLFDLQTNPSSSYHFKMEIEDFNGDGLLDIFYEESDHFNIRFQQTNNTFSNPITLGGFNNPRTEFLADDVNNDGKVDIIYDPNIWLKNIDNNGTFEKINNDIANDEIILSGVFQTEYNQFKLADIEGDGDLDFFYCNDLADNVDDLKGFYFFRNEDDSDPSAISKLNFISGNLHGLIETFPVDFDADGDEDVLLFSHEDDAILWQENLNGLGKFSSPIPLVKDSTIHKILPADIDNDGDLDLVGMRWFDTHSIFYLFEKIDSLHTFSTQTILSTDFITAEFDLVDWDNDGDLDLGVDQINRVKIYENQGGSIFELTSEIEDTGILMSLDDINSDGLTDIFYSDSLFHIHIAVQDSSGNFLHQEISQNTELKGRKILDIDEDGDLDVIVAKQIISNPSTTNFQLFLVQNNNGIFQETVIVPEIRFNNLFQDPAFIFYDVVDLDGDGKKDIFSARSWFRQLSDPLDFSSPISIEQFTFSTELHPGFCDFNGDSFPDIFYSYNPDAILWMSNNLASGYWLEGKVFMDSDNDCGWTAAIDTSLNNWLIEIQGNGQTLYTSTNINGNYTAFLPDSGNYTINVYPSSVYWEPCFVDSIVAVNDTINATIYDIPVQAESECPLLGLEMSMGLMRPCIPSSITLQYCNYGTLPADNAELEVLIDSNLIVNSSSTPWITQTDSSYIFDLGTVDINECDQITFSVTPDCNVVGLGDIVCVEAYITPDSLCLPTNNLWDGSTITVDGICDADSTTFFIENKGTGAMDEFRDVRVQIVNDEIIVLLYIDTFQLGIGGIKTIKLANNENAFRIEADQDMDHPVVLTASTIVSNCSNLPPNIANGLIFNFPNQDGDPFRETVCREITGSYDPNFKEAFPKGTFNRFIEKDWELEYNIHFQNEGTDTAFTVIVRDTIAHELDLSTLRIGASSHDMEWELTTERELIFTFNNILLPDKTTNEPLSHGYLQFFIKPVEDILPGTDIDNEAAIYFDFNAPVFTENVRRTIRVPTFSNSDYLELCEGDIFQNQIIIGDTILIDTASISGQGLFVDFYHLNVFPSVEFIDTTIAVGNYYNGILIQNDTVVVETYFENGCEKTVTIAIAIPTDVDELYLKNQFKVYPNPTSNQFVIEWKSSNIRPQVIEVFNANGQVIEKRNLENENISHQIVEVGDWRSGVYLLKMTTQFGTVYQKLIIIN